MEEKITYKKSYTRDNSLILQDAWGQGFLDICKNDFLEENPYGPINICYVTEGVVEVWDSEKGIKWFFDKLLEKNKSNPKYFKENIKKYNSTLEKIKIYNKKICLGSLKELKDFMDLLFKGIREFIIFYHSAMDKRTPEDIRKVSLEMRDKDTLFYDSNNTIRKTIEILYPKMKGLELVITPSDFDKMPEKEEIKERMKTFVFIPKKIAKILKLDNYLQENTSINFIFDKPNKENLESGIIKGHIAFKGKAQGKVRILKRKNQISEFIKGEILVSPMTTPDFIPAIKKASAIVTDEGGITCHAAIISREMKKPCIIGTKIATQILKDGDIVEVNADKGIVKILKKAES